MRLRIAIVLLMGLVVAGCGSDTSTPTTPTPSLVGNTPSGIPFAVGFSISGVGRYSVALNGQTYTAAGPFNVSLAPGSYNMSGTYSGGTFIVAFVRTSQAGGVQSGSIQSLSGPSVVTPSCGIAYSEPSQTQSFSLRFTVTNNANSAC